MTCPQGSLAVGGWWYPYVKSCPHMIVLLPPLCPSIISKPLKELILLAGLIFIKGSWLFQTFGPASPCHSLLEVKGGLLFISGSVFFKYPPKHFYVCVALMLNSLFRTQKPQATFQTDVKDISAYPIQNWQRSIWWSSCSDLKRCWPCMSSHVKSSTDVGMEGTFGFHSFWEYLIHFWAFGYWNTEGTGSVGFFCFVCRHLCFCR